MINLKEQTLEELNNLLEQVNLEIQLRKDKYNFTLETESNFEPQKHGHAYVALVFISLETNKTERKFIEGDNRLWDSKHKCYSQVFAHSFTVASPINT